MLIFRRSYCIIRAYRVSQEERTKLREGVPYVKLYCIITAYTRSIVTLEISERSYTDKMRSAVKTIVK